MKIASFADKAIVSALRRQLRRLTKILMNIKPIEFDGIKNQAVLNGFTKMQILTRDDRLPQLGSHKEPDHE